MGRHNSIFAGGCYFAGQFIFAKVRKEGNTMMKVTFVRHGQTSWNLLGKQQGLADIPLDETGIAQAHQTKELLKDKHFDRVYCSPLTRARQTAQIICEDRDIPILLEPRLIERDMGEFEGMTWHQFDTRAFWDYTANLHYQKAENIRDFYARVYSFLDTLKGKEGSVLLVAHGGVFAPVSSYAGHSKKEDNLLDDLIGNAQAFEFTIQ